MKKIYALFSFLLICGSQLTAQSYTINPVSKTISGNVYFGNTIDLEIRLDNALSGTLWLGYKAITNTLDANWGVTLCDYQTCYPFIPTGVEEMDSLLAGEHGFLKMSITPTSGISTGCVSFQVYDIHGSQIDTVTLCANVLGVGVDAGLSNSVTVAPNPASNFVQLSSLKGFLAEGNISLMNVNGQVVYSQKYNACNSINIPLDNCGNGMYFLNYETSEGRVVKKIQVIK